jgi:DNA-binding NarL/FixJ family response regulator
MNPVKVLIVDDQHLIREGLSSLLKFHKEVSVAAVASDGKDAIEKYKKYKPDVILMDIRMPVMDGITAAEKILAEGDYCKILMLTTFDDEEYILKSLKAGAVGYLMKDIPIEDLTRAIIQTYNGTFQLAPGVMEKLLSNYKSQEPEDSSQQEALELIYRSFSEREKEVVKLLGRGLNNREIADILFLSEGTVKNYVSSILTGLNLKDRTKAALTAIKAGWDKDS